MLPKDLLNSVFTGSLARACFTARCIFSVTIAPMDRLDKVDSLGYRLAGENDSSLYTEFFPALS